MAYTTFTDEQVFLKPEYNTLLNQIFSYMISEFTEIEVAEKFVVSGSVARIIQGLPHPDSGVKVIALRTSSDEMFHFFCSNIQSWTGALPTIYPDRVTLTWQDAHIELWLSEDTLTTVTIDGLYLEDDDFIPINIL